MRSSIIVWIIGWTLFITVCHCQDMKRVAFRKGMQAKYYRNGTWQDDQAQKYLSDYKDILQYCVKIYGSNIKTIVPAPNLMWIPNWRSLNTNFYNKESQLVSPFQCVERNLFSPSISVITAFSYCKFSGKLYQECQSYDFLNKTAHKLCSGKDKEVRYLYVGNNYGCSLMHFKRYDSLCCNVTQKKIDKQCLDVYLKEGKNKIITSADKELNEYTLAAEYLKNEYEDLNMSIKNQVSKNISKLKSEMKNVTTTLILVNNIHNARIFRFFESDLNSTFANLTKALKMPQTEKQKNQVARINQIMLSKSIDFLNYTLQFWQVTSRKMLNVTNRGIRDAYIRITHLLHLSHAVLMNKEDLKEQVFERSENLYKSYMEYNLKVIEKIFGKNMRGKKVTTPNGRLFLVTNDGDIVEIATSSSRIVAIIFGVILLLSLLVALLYLRRRRLRRPAYSHSPQHVLPPDLTPGFRPGNVTMSHLGDYVDDEENVYHDNHAKLEIGYENAMFDANDKTKIVS